MNAVTSEVIRKQYFSRVEAATEIGVPYHVIRYWQREFGIRPKASLSNKSFIHRDQIALLHHVKRLLKDEKYTIKGAKIKLREARLI